jgi:hypothetical protein
VASASLPMMGKASSAGKPMPREECNLSCAPAPNTALSQS